MGCLMASITVTAMYSLDRMSDEDDVEPPNSRAPPPQITTSQLAAALMATGSSTGVCISSATL